MNCKEGDIAVLVKANLPENLGSICEVLSATGNPDFEWSVRFQSPKRLIDFFGDIKVDETCFCPDAWLRPLRDPGDDAVDETLLFKPVPVPEES